MTDTIAGYYTLSAADIPVTDAPEEMTKRLSRYPSIPAARLGRLEVDEKFRGMKLCGALLFDAVQRAGRSEVAMHAMVVDAKDRIAEAFYRHHGFATYGSAPGQLIAPLSVLLKAKDRGVQFGKRPALTKDQIADLREKRAAGTLIKDLMAHYSLSKATIYRYLGASEA